MHADSKLQLPRKPQNLEFYWYNEPFIHSLSDANLLCFSFYLQRKFSVDELKALKMFNKNNQLNSFWTYFWVYLFTKCVNHWYIGISPT